MTDSSIACLPVWVRGCPDGCVAGNKIPAKEKINVSILQAWNIILAVE